MANVNVSNVGGTFIEDLGRSVLPANVLPFDFSALDRAVETENDISKKALDVITNNVKDLGRITDEITGITAPSVYHAGELEAAKKSLGIDRAALVGVVSNIDNPVAAYDLDRRMKRLQSDPRVKEIMYANSLTEAFKQGIPNITDPNLRAKAIADLDNATKSNEKNAITNLNLDQYKSIDLESAYEEALDKFAPYIPSTEQVMQNGVSMTVTVNKRDPEMVAKTREYFMKNAGVRNNLFANGYIDETGKPLAVGKSTWFDDLEAPQLVPIQQISNVKGISGSSGKYNYTLPNNMNGLSYTPNVQKDATTGMSFDLGVIAGAETGGRNPDSVVHVDPSGNAINIGAYSFNGGTGGPAYGYLDYLQAHTFGFPSAMAALEELKSIPLKGGDLKANAARAKAAYQKLEQSLGKEALVKLENEYAIDHFAVPVIDYLQSKEGFEDTKLTTGEATVLMDTAIQWSPKTWKKWIDEYTENGGNTSLAEFITKKRIEQAAKNANDGMYSAELAQQIGDRAVRVWQAAAGMDGNTSTPSSTGGKTNTQNNSGVIDVSQFNQYIDPGVSAAVDSINNNQAQDAVTFWTTPAQ